MIPWRGNVAVTFDRNAHRRTGNPGSIFSKNTNRKQREGTHRQRERGRKKEKERERELFRAQQTLKQWRKNRDQDEGYDENGWQIFLSFFFFSRRAKHTAQCVVLKSVFLLDAGHPPKAALEAATFCAQPSPEVNGKFHEGKAGALLNRRQNESGRREGKNFRQRGGFFNLDFHGLNPRVNCVCPFLRAIFNKNSQNLFTASDYY